MMLSTDSRNANFYSDSLRACVIAAIAEPETCRNTIKLVATNLIANGKLHEGIELLVLTNNGLDACRYLQTYGEWDKAARLAKTSLPQPEADEIMYVLFCLLLLRRGVLCYAVLRIVRGVGVSPHVTSRHVSSRQHPPRGESRQRREEGRGCSPARDHQAVW